MAEVVAELNRLAATADLDAAGAANRWAGTTGLDLVAALNVKASTSGLDLGGVCQALARAQSVTTGLEPAATLALLT